MSSYTRSVVQLTDKLISTLHFIVDYLDTGGTKKTDIVDKIRNEVNNRSGKVSIHNNYHFTKIYFLILIDLAEG